MSEPEHNPHIINSGYRIDPVTGEKLPLTPEEEALGARMLETSWKATQEAYLRDQRRKKRKASDENP